MQITPADHDAIGFVQAALDRGLRLDGVSPAIARMWRELSADLSEMVADSDDGSAVVSVAA
jgi:hypothetical protein